MRAGLVRISGPVARVLLAALVWVGCCCAVHAQQDVSAQIQASLSGLVLNRVTNTFNSILTLTNTGAAVYAPMAVQISTNSAAVTVQNGNAVPNAANTFTVPVTLPLGSLVRSESIKINVAFADRTRVSFTPTVAGITGAAAPAGLNLMVSSPPQGLPVAGPTFLVAGILSGPSLTGVSVNNMGGCVMGQAFYSNSFRPGAGTSSFTVAARDVDGGALNLSVPYVASVKGITVSATPNCGGLAPLNALFDVALETADGDTLQSVAIDFNGDGTTDQTVSAPIAPYSIAFTYANPGLYRANFTATTVQGSTLTQSVLVNVQTPAAAFTPVSATLSLLQSALAAGNAARAASYFAPTSQPKYLSLFTQAGAALGQNASLLAGAVPEAMSGDFAQLLVTGPGTANYSIVMVRDSAGFWRVDSW